MSVMRELFFVISIAAAVSQPPLLLPTPPLPPRPNGVGVAKPAPDPKTASIRGTVLDDTRRPVAGALVRVLQQGVYVRGSAPGKVSRAYPGIYRNIRTAPNGTYTMEALPAGTYIICVVGAARNHLGSCEWGGKSVYVPVKIGLSAVAPPSEIRNGALLEIEIADTKGRLDGLARSPFGVQMADGYFARPVLASATKSSKIYQIAVPKGPGLQIRWESELAAVGMEGERVAPNSVYPLPDVAVTPAKVRLSVD